MLQALSWAALGTGFTFLMTTLGAAVVFFFVEEPRPQFQRTMLGFAAGVMTAASVWSLLLPAIEQSADFGVPGWLPAAAGLLLGVGFLSALDAVLPHLRRAKDMDLTRRQSTLLMAAITLHNVPEGMAVGLAFALAALLILGMTVTGAAADPALNQKLKINQVAAGDTVKAYRLIEYDATFNGYTFYASFETFLEAEKNAAGFNSLSVQEYFTEKIGTTGVAELLGKYAAACAKTPATYTLPAVTAEQVAAAEGITSTPCRAAFPIAAMTAVGVASTRAQGQKTTSTVTARMISPDAR